MTAEAAFKVWWDQHTSSIGGYAEMPQRLAFVAFKAAWNSRHQVLQDWVCGLSYMQQSVLITAVRGPDTIRKDHVAKLVLRWLRRCVLFCAFDGGAVMNPYDPRGGSFTGPSIGEPKGDGWSGSELVTYWTQAMTEKVHDYLRTVDELPHHFQLHLMHAAEIIGYKHPDQNIAEFWQHTYLSLVNDMHLMPELPQEMDMRLGDSEQHWRAREEVVAKGPEDRATFSKMAKQPLTMCGKQVYPGHVCHMQKEHLGDCV